MLTGGLLYTAGAISYHRRRPDPYPSVFGYHEVFHAYVCAAATCPVYCDSTVHQLSQGAPAPATGSVQRAERTVPVHFIRSGIRRRLAGPALPGLVWMSAGACRHTRQAAAPSGMGAGR